MSRLSGAVLVLAGLGIAAYTATSSSNVGPAASEPEQPATHGVAQAQIEAPSNGNKQASAAAEPQGTAKVVPPQPVPAVKPASFPAAVIAVPPRRIPVSQQAEASGPPLDRAGLAREIQRHLKRVGCYSGDIHGVWTPAARRSMKTFTDRVNATLPIDDPDHVLLAMVQSHKGVACGRGCPTGETEVDDGRCLPKGIVAQGSKRPAAVDPQLHAKAGTDATVTPAPDVASGPPPQGRMALAGPQVVDEASASERKLAAQDRPGRRYEPGDRRSSDERGERRRPPRNNANRLPGWAAAAFGLPP